VRFPFIPREEKFFDLFEESAQNLVQAAQLLAKLMEEWEGVEVEEKVRQITELEHKGDSITHQVMAQLHRTFVTPLDREDISALAHCLDDVIDFIQAAADAMFIYRIDHPTKRAKELAGIIIDTTIELEKAMPGLRHHHQLEQIKGRCVEVNRLENEGDRVKRVALAELFQDTTDIAQIIKWREIYEHLESATDRCEDVANVLEGVVLKHA
jgi:predicted phosphate transport protein (TIGR00153 family)